MLLQLLTYPLSPSKNKLPGITHYFMIKFQTQYRYAVLAGYVLMSLICAATLTLFVYWLIKIIPQQSQRNPLKLYAGGIVVLGYFAVLFAQLGKVLRFGFLIDNQAILLKDYLFNSQADISNDVKGYSKTNLLKQTIILYLKDGRKINLSRWMISNFNEVEEIFLCCNIPYLGSEVFAWKDIFKRKYKFG